MDPILNDLLAAAARESAEPCHNYPSSGCEAEGRTPNHVDPSQRWCLSCLIAGLYGAFTALDVATTPPEKGPVPEGDGSRPTLEELGADTPLGGAPPAFGPPPPVSPDTPLGGGPIGLSIADETSEFEALKKRLEESTRAANENRPDPHEDELSKSVAHQDAGDGEPDIL